MSRDRDQLRDRLAEAQAERRRLRDSLAAMRRRPHCPRYKAEDEDRLFALDREIGELSARLGDRD